MIAKDYNLLLLAAERAIRTALEDGEHKSHKSEWREQTIDGQLRHIEAHVTAYQCCDRSEDHLSHILCRAAIACAL